MARKRRVHYPGAVYHVMLRGNGGRAFFLMMRIVFILESYFWREWRVLNIVSTGFVLWAILFTWWFKWVRFRCLALFKMRHFVLSNAIRILLKHVKTDKDLVNKMKEIEEKLLISFGSDSPQPLSVPLLR